MLLNIYLLTYLLIYLIFLTGTGFLQSRKWQLLELIILMYQTASAVGQLQSVTFDTFVLWMCAVCCFVFLCFCFLIAAIYMVNKIEYDN